MNIFIIYLFVTAPLILGSFSFLFIRNKKKQKSLELLRKGVKKDVIYDMYVFFNDIKIFSYYFDYVRQHVAKISISTVYDINKATFTQSVKLLSISMILTILTLSNPSSFVFKLISFCIIIIIHNVLLKGFVEVSETKQLILFDRFLSNVRHNFHEFKMIDEAILYSIDKFSGNFEKNMKIIYEAIASADNETTVSEYIDETSNKYFKTFISLCLQVDKYGDVLVDESSVFLQNLSYLKQDIDIESLKRKRMKHIFMGMNFLILSPIFFIKPMENWLRKDMTALATFFDSPIGFVTEILLLFIIILCYVLMSKLKSGIRTESELLNTIYARILENKLIKSLCSENNKNYTKTERLKILLRESGYRKPITHFYLTRLLFFGCGVLISIFLSFKTDDLTRSMILNPVFAESVTVNGAESIEKISNDIVKEVINHKVSISDIEQTLMERISARTSEEQIKAATENIIRNIEIYNKQYFKWYELILAIAIGVGTSYIPLLLVQFDKYAMVTVVEDEIAQFQSIILMLMNNESIDVLNILEWLEMFAVYFKDSISVCINEYEKNDIKALENLLEKEEIESFRLLVGNLISAVEKLEIKNAFDEIAVERKFYLDKAKQEIDMELENKKSIINIIAVLPFGAVIFVKLLLPIIYISNSGMSSYSSGITTMLN